MLESLAPAVDATLDTAPLVVPSTRGFLSALLQTRLLDDATTPWKERVHESEDAFNYLSLSMIVPDSGLTTMATIEFGVRDANLRHAVGILLADWHHDECRLGPIQVMTVDGEGVDMATFAARLRPLLDLPTVFRDVAEDTTDDE